MPTQEFDLDAKTLALVPAGRLSERYKSNALKQAIEIVTSTRQSAKATGNKASCPRFTGEAVLDGKFVNLEDKETCPGNPFDLAIRLSTLKKGKRITILTNRTRPLNKWLCRPNSRLVQGCSLSENWITLWVEEPNPFVPWAPGPEAVVYSGDLGMRKLLSVEDDWERWATGFGRTKEFRRKRLPWAHRSVLERLLAKATENRVLVIAVYARGTSRECPNTLCGCASALNRKNEVFRCIACGYTADADRVGAHNIRSRTLVILARRRDWLQEHPRGRSHGRSTLRAQESLLCTSAA